MKKLFFVLASFFIAGIVFSQTQSTVTINTTGNRNKQLLVDNRSYTITNTNATEEQAIIISDITAGQHSLDVIRTNQYNSRVSTKTYFTVREGYDLTITINSNGAVSTSETRITRANAGKPITTAAFNKLYTQTKAKTSSSARATFLGTEFAKTNRKFTASQASQLIQLVNSESLRLKLAKQTYPVITDRQNFNVVSNLLNSSANRTELNNYVASLDLEDDDYAASDMGAPMTAEKFSTIYNEVYAETNSGERDYYLRNFFSKDYNFYTSTQASQLIRLVPGEEERFNLAKAAYKGTSDKANYAVVSQLLYNTGNRSALTAYINSYNNTNPNINVRTAMSTADFDRLYQAVYYQSSSARYATINTAFTTSGNYFTVAQAKKLIPLVTGESNRLTLAKTAYSGLVDRSNYAQFNEFLSYSSSESDLYNYVLNFNNNSQVGNSGMSATEFNSLYQNVANSWSQSSRVSLITDAFRYSNYFTVDQVRQLLLLVSSESDRLAQAKNAYDNVVDQPNFSRLYDLFTYASYRNDLANFVAGNGGTGAVGVTHVAMTESEYNSLYRSVQMTFGFGAKMSVLAEIFNTETNYFTVEQAKQLIRLVSDEDNRLTLAKSSYNNIVDTENFGNIYDIFSSQSSKDALKNYVNSNVYIN